MTTNSCSTVIAALLLLILQGVTPAAVNKAEGRAMFCYFGTWADYRPSIANFDVPNIDASLCSHVIYAYTGLQNGVLVSLDEYNDYETNYGKGTMKKFITHANINGFTPLLAVGGWNQGSTKYSQMASTSYGRETFVNSAVSFLQRFGFQGLQFDWEYPTMYGGSVQDKQNFVLLLETLAQRLHAANLILSVGVAGSPQIAASAYDFAGIGKHADFIQVMTFDYHSSSSDRTTAVSSPLSSSDGLSVEDTINLWLAGGAPANKLVVGIPLYARSYSLASSEHGLGAPVLGAGTPGQYSQEAGLLTYYEMCMNPSWTEVSDYEPAYVYSYSSSEWLSYDDSVTVAAKAQYVVDKGLAGMMAFSLESEDFHGYCGQPNSLLTSANKVLGRL